MKIALVCSHGGHLTQMNMLVPALEGHEHFWVTYRCVRTEAMAAQEHVYLLTNIGTNPARMAVAFFHALRIMLVERPRVVISTGAEIAIPFSWVGKVLGARVVYIESWSRIHTRSGTGPLVYPVTDLFLVQWPDVLRFYGSKARYVGGLI
ncbi:MAG TPA: PssD/Cps14F family polysaccharide biosynthesis glycosyltransferase [Anaerolineae bacterium]|nr:PssD/Cps14F family polysaccharide biosynthesis glycosyltransferase [Anaerolineae bacterium]